MGLIERHKRALIVGVMAAAATAAFAPPSYAVTEAPADSVQGKLYAAHAGWAKHITGHNCCGKADGRFSFPYKPYDDGSYDVEIDPKEYDLPGEKFVQRVEKSKIITDEQSREATETCLADKYVTEKKTCDAPTETIFYGVPDHVEPDGRPVWTRYCFWDGGSFASLNPTSKYAFNGTKADPNYTLTAFDATLGIQKVSLTLNMK